MRQLTATTMTTRGSRQCNSYVLRGCSSFGAVTSGGDEEELGGDATCWNRISCVNKALK
jgi:hypothetical protein